jgi:hypothetical protein
MNISDIFAQDLRGHEYLKARGLNPQIVRERQHVCPTCRQAEMLPAVLNILEKQKERMQ